MHPGATLDPRRWSRIQRLWARLVLGQRPPPGVTAQLTEAGGLRRWSVPQLFSTLLEARLGTPNLAGPHVVTSVRDPVGTGRPPNLYPVASPVEWHWLWATCVFATAHPTCRYPIQTPMSVPQSGPTRLDVSSSVETAPRPRARCERGNVSAAIASATGTSAPPPTAVSARASVSRGRLGASATSTEPPMKMTRPSTKMRRWPCTSAAGPRGRRCSPGGSRSRSRPPARIRPRRYRGRRGCARAPAPRTSDRSRRRTRRDLAR